jgi:hypothetical protein
MADAGERWYELGVTPSMDKFPGAVPTLKKVVTSPNGRDHISPADVQVVIRAA